MIKPTLSVILPNYNHAHFLAQVFKEIIGQNHPPDEIIIIDDGSTDNSVSVIGGIVTANPDVNIKFLQNDKNRGAIYTANRGAKEASCQYIYFAAADDTIAPNFFEETLRVLEQYPQAGLCSSIVTSIDVQGISIQMQMPLTELSPGGQYFDLALCRNLLRKQDSWTGGNSCVYRREAFLECGGLIQELGSHCDIFLGMLVAVKYGVCYLPKAMTSFRLMPLSYSSSTSLQEHLQSYTLMAQLMRTTYADLFPLDYADSFELGEHYRSKIATMMKQTRQQLAMMEGMVEKKNRLDKVFFVFMKIISYVLLIGFLCYSALRLRPKMWIVLKRGLVIKIKYLKGWGKQHCKCWLHT